MSAVVADSAAAVVAAAAVDSEAVVAATSAERFADSITPAIWTFIFITQKSPKIMNLYLFVDTTHLNYSILFFFNFSNESLFVSTSEKYTYIGRRN